jgi:acetylornithine/succinyldiaminopimelate/putrescine aminotransferase/predicted amino acid dehydrogenase
MITERVDKPVTSERTALNPELYRLLQFCNMNRTWVRGQGVWLYDEQGRAFLDCYSQYGVIALGHNALCVTETVKSAFRDAEPAMVQPFRAPHAIRLAQCLVDLAPGQMSHCVFTNSGAETVEAAIKLSRVSSGRSIILSCAGAYHGKTLGAMAVSGNSVCASLYGAGAPAFDKIPYGDTRALADYLAADGDKVAAFFVEPIQGEGGVRLPPDGYLSDVRELCTQYRVAMVLDEIQTGLGRTGQLFCCQHEGVAPDMLLLSKALGGGLFPIGACLSVDQFWDPRFALTHSSTFANNNIASRVALSVLHTINGPGFCEDVERKGQYLLTKLQELASCYPKIIREVRGRGLMLAIQLNPSGFDEGLFAAYLRHQNLFGYAFAATMVENESIIVVPTLGNVDTIRIMPPLIISDEQIDGLLDGLRRVLDACSKRLTETVVRAMSGLSRPEIEAPAEKTPLVLPPAARAKGNRVDAARFAFLIHYTQPNDVLITDPGLAVFNDEEMNRYCSFIADMPPGVVYEMNKLQSRTGAEVTGWLIALGMLPEEMYRRGYSRVACEIKRGVDLAAELGAQVVGLGAFTSIFSRQGMAVTGRGPAITTGNILTAEMAFRAIGNIADRQGLSIDRAKVGIVGARGSVGSLCAQLLARAGPRSMVLVGNASTSEKRLDRVHDRLRSLTSCPIEVTAELSKLCDCDIIVSATSSRFPILDDVALRAGTIVCDVARPQDAGEITRSRSDLTVVDGGLVLLPDSTIRFGKGNIQGFPDGVQLACLSETMLLALAGETRDFGIGDTATLDDVDYVSKLADSHGFGLAVPAMDKFESVSRRFEEKRSAAMQGVSA